MKPSIVADIMITQVITCTPKDPLSHVRQLMKAHSIRHIPVLDQEGRIVGLVTQKSVLKETLEITNRFGMVDFARQEQKINVSDFMETSIETIQPQLTLLDAGRFFIECKHGCLPVVHEGNLVGILTSADFVKLSVTLLQC